MATNFYLADARYMTPPEIAQSCAKEALVCHRSRTEDGMVYSLAIHPIYFFNLPRDTRLINDNAGTAINTIGDLVDAATKEDAILRNPDEVRKERNKYVREWLLSLPDVGPRAIFNYEKRAVANGAEVDTVFNLGLSADNYLRRSFGSETKTKFI